MQVRGCPGVPLTAFHMASSVFKPSDPRAATASPRRVPVPRSPPARRPRPPRWPRPPTRCSRAPCPPPRRSRPRARACSTLAFFFGDPVRTGPPRLPHGPSAHPRPAARCAGRPEKLRDYSEHHAMCAARPRRAPPSAPLGPRPRSPRPRSCAGRITSPTPVRSRARPHSERPCRRRPLRRLRSKYENSRNAQQPPVRRPATATAPNSSLPPPSPPAHARVRAQSLKAPQEWHTQVALPFVRVRRARSLPARPNAALARGRRAQIEGTVRSAFEPAPPGRLLTPADAC